MILEPLVIANKQALIVCDKSFFEGIGLLDETNKKMTINVDSDGLCNFGWILDFNGLLYKLSKIDQTKETFLTRIGWDRRRCIFSIASPTTISSGSLRELLSGFSDEYSDIPNVADLLELLNDLKDDDLVTTEILKIFHNEE